MVYASNLGFPRMGSNRQLKKLVENYWAKKISPEELIEGAKVLLLFYDAILLWSCPFFCFDVRKCLTHDSQ